MKRITGLKTLSISAIVINSILFIRLLNAWFRFGVDSSVKDIALLLLAVFGFVGSILYPVQLLLMRKKYYRYVPISSGARTFLHIARIIQLLFTIVIAILLIASTYNILRNMHFTRRFSYLYIQAAMLLLLLTLVLLNLTIFFKGWRL